MSATGLLSTAQAARLVGVTPSTLKRWADQGLVEFARTPGGHRRFDRRVIDRFLSDQSRASFQSAPWIQTWIKTLSGGKRHEIDGALLEARDRLGRWCDVANELGKVLIEMGRNWRDGKITIAEEHMASHGLRRALYRVTDSLPMRVDTRRCVLASPCTETHTLGLSLTELCLREVGWIPVWLGGPTPVTEIVRLVASGDMSMVALSASEVTADSEELARITETLEAVCRPNEVTLVLGGEGAWPRLSDYAIRMGCFANFHDLLLDRLGRRRT